MTTPTPMQLRSSRVLEYLKVKGKIDSYAFFDLVGILPHEGQRRILDAYLEKTPPCEETAALGLSFDYRYKTLVAACGRRFGKSFVTSGLGAEEMLYPNAQVLICSYRLENCKVIFRQVRDLIKKLGIEIVADRQKDLELELINGARLCVASNDNVESRLGNAVSLLIIDEAKLFQRSLYETFLEPQLLDYAPYSRTIMISSPAPGWLETYYDRGQSTDPRYSDYWSVSLPSSTNPTNSKAFLEKLKARVPPDIWEQEYEGKFISAEGKVFKEFDTKLNVFDEDSHPYFWDWVRNGRNIVFHSIDSGYSHYFAGIYCLYHELLDTFFVFGEYQVNKTVTSVHAENIFEYERTRSVDVTLRFADPAASQQIADLAELGLHFNKSSKNLRETINCANTLFFQLSEVTGDKRCLVHRDCVELIRQLTSLHWKEDAASLTREASAAGTKPFKPDADMKTDWDLIDAFRYGMFSYTKNGRIGVTVVSTEPDNDDDDSESISSQMARAGYIRVGSAVN